MRVSFALSISPSISLISSFKVAISPSSLCFSLSAAAVPGLEFDPLDGLDAKSSAEAMQKQISEIRSEDEKGAEHVRTAFNEQTLVEKKKRKTVIKRQSQLQSTKKQLLEKKAHLTDEVHHLEEVNQGLHRQVDRFGQFLSKESAKLKDAVEARNQFEAYAYQLRGSKDGLSLESDDAVALDAALATATAWLDEHTSPAPPKEDSDAQRKALEEVANPIMSKAYQAPQPEEGTGGGDTSPPDDDLDDFYDDM